MGRRLALTLLTAVAVATVSAVTIAITDLYLSGHGYSYLMREAIIWRSGGVHLSIGDVVLISATLLAAALAWWTYDPTA